MHVLIILLIFPLGQIAAKQSSIDSVKTNISWSQFYKNHIQSGNAVVFPQACKDNKAFRLWSPDYVYYHPGAAVTFRNWTTSTLSIRKLIDRRDEMGKMHFRVPEFLSVDLKLPSFLACELMVRNIKTPSFLWHFVPASVNLQETHSHEIWCLLTGSITLILIPEASPDLANQFITSEMFKEINFHQADMKAGDCFYVPDKVQRQYKATKDTMGVIYDIPETVLEKNRKELEECQVWEGTSWVEFVDDDLVEEGDVKHTAEMRRFISYLGKTNCIDFPLFWDSMQNDPELVWLDRKDTREALGQEVFDAFDQNHDGHFCWDDVDSWTLQMVTQLAQLIKTKQVVLDSGMGEFNRKAAKKIHELGVDYKDPRFLETIWESLVEQYGDKVGNIFDGPAHKEMREEMEREREDRNDEGGRKKLMHTEEL